MKLLLAQKLNDPVIFLTEILLECNNHFFFINYLNYMAH